MFQIVQPNYSDIIAPQILPYVLVHIPILQIVEHDSMQ